MSTPRARSDRAKQARHDDIVGAARSCFDGTEFDELTMDAVAAELGLAKGTLYRYFPTREGLLLALTLDEYRAWFDAVDARLDARMNDRATLHQGSETDAVTAVTTDLVAVLVASPRFMRLVSLVPSVLERNVPVDMAREFKVLLLERITSTSVRLATVLGSTPERCAQLLVHLQAVVIGLYHHAHPAPVVDAVLGEPELAPFRIDLATELTHAVRAYARAATTEGDHP